MPNQKFMQQMCTGYGAKGPTLYFGAPLLDDECYAEQPVQLPLSTLNRHGLISGATGSGKTKTLQLFAEGLSNHGVPVLLMDLKGDLSGLGAMGEPNQKIIERHELLDTPFKPQAFPLEFLTLSKGKGVPLRATVSEFGPLLLSQILGLNDTQGGILALLFQYCDDEQLPLVDLKDLKKTINYLKKQKDSHFDDTYGKFSAQSASAILRKITELEQQGANTFFGEPSFDVQDLCRRNQGGKGVISCLSLQDIQSKPKLFSTFMLCLLAEVYATFEEVGDLDKPKLVMFIDEAHLIFNNASKALLEHLETVIKLIRSKGVGIYFCTQTPKDIPESILGQLGLKIQHSLRAFTAKDRKSIKLVAENFPDSLYYDTKTMLTQLGIGEALITGINEKGSPTPLVHTLLRAPFSRMAPLSPHERSEQFQASNLYHKYADALDRESAFEILQKRMEKTVKVQQKEVKAQKSTARKGRPRQTLAESMAKQAGRTFIRELTRGLLGVLGLNRRRR